MKNRKFDEFDLLPVSSHEMGEFMFRLEFKIKRIISKSVEEDEFEMERVVKFVEEYGVKESARGLKLSEEEVVKNVSEYIKNVNRRIQDLQKMVDQESSQMANDGKYGTEMQESRLKTSKEKGGDKSVHVQEMWTSKVVENREFVLLHTTKLVDIIGYREYELAQVIKVVESMNIEDSGHILGLEYLEVVDKVKEYIRLKKSRIEFLLHNVVQESELMREKLGSAATNTNQEPHLDNSVSLAVFVSHQELLCNESDEKKGGDKSVCVNERMGETESGQESHLKTLNEEGDKSVNEPVSGISGGMSTAGMQIGGHEYPPLPAGRLTGQKQLGVEESNERDSEPKSGQKTSNDEKEDGESVRVEKRTVKESESKSGQESHLKSLDEEKEKGDKSVNHVEVRNERESVLESGQMMSHEESESGDKCVNHVEKIERDVKSESGQQMKEEIISTETENVEAGNEKGSEEVTGSGMLTISREVGDSMQVAGQGNGRGSSRDQQLQQSVYDGEYAPLPGQTGQQRVKESEPKSGQGLHLKLLDEEKEEGDKSADVEVGNERESVPESGQMTLNEENEGGGNSVNHFEQKNESEVKSDSGQEMNEEKVSTESVNAEAGNEKGSEKVTGSGMLTVSTEVGDIQVAAGQGHGSGSSSGQQQLQPSVNGRGWGRGYVSGQQPQNELPIEDPPAPAPVQGALAPYIDFALARPSRPNKRGKKVHK